MEQPLVNICMITYNHEPFIREAIEGVLMQQTSFPYILVIGEDCSTDNTLEICQEYARTYPEKIQLLTEEQNLGMLPNFKRTLEACTGKYIALCEGDDYWTDPLKLQRQVEFLEENVMFGGTAENASVLFDDGTTIRFGRRNSRILSIAEIIRCRQFATASLLFRNQIMLPPDFLELIVGDSPLSILIQSYQPIYYNNVVSSIYRRGSQGITYHFKTKHYRESLIKHNLIMDNWTDYKYSYLFRRRIASEQTWAQAKLREKLIKTSILINKFIEKLYAIITNQKQPYYIDLEYLPFWKILKYRLFG